MKKKKELCSLTLALTAVIFLLMGVASAAPFAYITNMGANTVSVIDTNTNTIMSTVNGLNIPIGSAVNPDGTRVYVANSGTNTVSVIDTDTNDIINTVTVGNNPYGVAVNPAGTRVYVADNLDGTVSVIDTNSNTVTDTVTVGENPYGVAVNPAGTRVYAANYMDVSVSVIDTSSNTVIDTVTVGNGPKGVAVTQDGTKVYVADNADGTVSVIDTATNTVTDTVTVGVSPEGVAVNPTGTRAYVANSADDTVSVIDTSSNTVIGTVTVGDGPLGISVNPAGTRVYVANSGTTSVSVIDTNSNTVTGTINGFDSPAALGLFIGGQTEQPVLPVANFSSNVTSGYAPLSVQFNDSSENATAWNWDFGDGENSTEQNPTHTFTAAGNYTVNLTASNVNGTNSTLANITVSSQSDVQAGRYAYITNSGSHNVSVIDTETNAVITTIPVGNTPWGVAVNPDGSYAYVTNSADDNISVIDTATNTVTATVDVGDSPWAVAVNPDETKAYVTNYLSNSVSVIDTTNNTVTATVDVGTNPFGVAINPEGTTVYVANVADGNVSVIDAANNTITANVTVGEFPYGVAISPDGTEAYVVNMGSGNVSVIDTANNNVLASVPVGNSPQGVAVSPDGTKAYVTNSDDDTVSVIDTINKTVTGSVTVGEFPYGVSVSHDGTKVFVANGGGNTVSVIDTANNTVTATVTVGSNPYAFGLFIGGVQTAQPILPVANFSSNVTSGNFPLTVQFNDSSENADEWYWDFGDGDDSNEQNPMHTFSAAGNYTVNLTASNTNGTNSTFANITVLEQPAGSAQFAYITNAESNNVSVIDTANDSVIATVDVGQAPWGVAVNPDGTNVYVANSYLDNTVSVISIATNTVIANVSVGSDPTGIAVTPDGTKVYVTNWGGTNVSVINTATNTVTATVDVGDYPLGVAVNPDGTKVYVADYDDNNVSVIDISNNTVTAAVPVGINPRGVAVSPDGTKVYVTNEGSDNVSVIDATNNTVTATVPVESKPIGVAISPDGTKVYAANEYSNTISIIDSSNNTVTDTVEVGVHPYGVAFNLAGTKAYVANQESDNVSVINTATNTVIYSVPVGGNPFAFGQFVGEGQTAQPILPVANFSSNVTSGYVPLTVLFNDSSENATAWNWDFGDGDNSTEQDPIHTFTAAGNYTVNLTASNANGTNSTFVNITVVKATPIITWDNPDDIIYGTALNETQLNATASVPGNFTYDPDNGTLLGAGNDQELNAEFTPDDAANYTTETANVSINVTQATPEITWDDPDDIVYGTSLNETQLNATSSVPGNFTYDPDNGTVLGAGNDLQLNADFTPDDATNYTTESANVSINVTQATPIITWDDPDDIVYGTALNETQLNATSSVNGSFVYTPDNGTVLSAGNDQELNAEFTPEDAANYTTETANVSINVTQATPTITWDDPDDIVYGTSLNETQLNATSSVPGNFTYDPDNGTVLSAGNDQELNADFTPDDAANYTTETANVSINVTQATPTITWDDPDDIVYGTALNDTQLNATASVPGNFTYDPDNGTVLGAGNDLQLNADFTPDDATNYTTESATVTINVTSATPVITWDDPDDIVYGTSLSETQLNATSSVNGSFVYTPDNGTILGVGQHTLQANFTPTDATNYTNASKNVTVNVSSVTPVITWNNPSDIVYGTALNVTQLNATASVNGNFTYNPTTETVLDVGQHILQANFTPTDAANYTNASKNVTINVSAQPVLPVANFSTNVTEGYAPLSVQFNDSSTNATSWNWNFGDGQNSTERNPVHTFSAGGNYTVNLTASNANGTSSRLANITVFSLPIYPVANFNANVTVGDVPLSVQFNDSSTNATAWHWDFGDGNNSAEQNPVHTFSAAENYTVNLTVSNEFGANSTFANITVLEQSGLGANLYLSINALESKHPGSSMNYTLYYQNFGDKTAQNVVLEDILSTDIEFESASDGGIYNNSTGTVRWDIGSVSPTEYGYRTITVEIPLNVTNGTVIYNNASIITTDNETTYDDNEISVQTLVASQNLPENVSVEPTVGDAGTPSVYWGEPITFSYHTCDSATGVNISVHIDDGQPDIVGNMTGGPSDWTYTTTFYPRTGKAAVNYTVYGCDQAPVSFSIYVDPAGYIYDIDTLNRIAGASVWLQRPDGTGGWENVPTGQSPAIAQPDTNPLITDNNGMYQWDVLNGTYRVHVEATGYEPKNSYAVTVPPAVTDLHVGLMRTAEANYSIFKSVIDPDPTGDCIINRAGDKVPYRIVVKNEGEMNLTNVTVSDTLISPLPDPIGDDTDPGVLNTGETWTYDAVYTLTSEDVENGSINNNATVTCDQLPEKTSSVSTPVDQNAELSIYKSVTGIDETGDNIINEVGDVINYQVAVKNNGNIDLTDVLVSDPMVDLTLRTGDRADTGVLNPGETWVYAGNYIVTQEDIDGAKVGNVFIENTATVSCSQLSEAVSSLELPIIYIPPDPPNVLTPEQNSIGLLVANFSTNVTSGYAPLSVRFTDLSQNAISRSWDFNNDGSIDSTDTNPVYTYLIQGTYTVNLTVSNVNGSVSKTASIKVLQTNSSGKGGSYDISGGGASEGKAVVVKDDAIGSSATTTAAANVSPTENNNGQSSTPANVEPTPVQTSTGTPEKESKKTPGFGLLCGITGLLAVYLYRRK